MTGLMPVNPALTDWKKGKGASRDAHPVGVGYCSNEAVGCERSMAIVRAKTDIVD
jgi:hypothetical protein